MLNLRGLLLLLMAVPSAVIASEPENVTVIGVNQYLSAGASALQRGAYEDGIELTLEGLRFESSRLLRASALNNLCAGYIAVRQYDRAIESCDDALEINALNWRIYNNRALAYLGVNRIAAARQELARGLALNPESRKLDEVRELIESKEGRLQLAVGN